MAYSSSLDSTFRRVECLLKVEGMRLGRFIVRELVTIRRPALRANLNCNAPNFSISSKPLSPNSAKMSIPPRNVTSNYRQVRHQSQYGSFIIHEFRGPYGLNLSLQSAFRGDSVDSESAQVPTPSLPAPGSLRVPLASLLASRGVPQTLAPPGVRAVNGEHVFGYIQTPPIAQRFPNLSRRVGILHDSGNVLFNTRVNDHVDHETRECDSTDHGLDEVEKVDGVESQTEDYDSMEVEKVDGVEIQTEDYDSMDYGSMEVEEVEEVKGKTGDEGQSENSDARAGDGVREEADNALAAEEDNDKPSGLVVRKNAKMAPR